jgi:mono/diheme cytochrome c family protein
MMSSRRRITTIAVLSSALILSALLSACNPNPPAEALTPIPTLAPFQQVALVGELRRPAEPTPTSVLAVAGEGNAATGATVYLLHCSPCHGVAGQGVDAPRFRDSIHIQQGDVEELFVTVADGVPETEMPAWLQSNGGPLESAQIYDVIAYLRTLREITSLPAFERPAPEAAPTPLSPGAPTPEPARPSMPGEVGNAVSLAGDADRGRPAFGRYCARCHGPEGVQGVCNPGSDDGSVPTLNPIDPTIANVDPKLFGTNVDLFIEHGSIPEGSAPMIMMPSFGDSNMLTDQEIADLIAYVIGLNQSQDTE